MATIIESRLHDKLCGPECSHCHSKVGEVRMIRRTLGAGVVTRVLRWLFRDQWPAITAQQQFNHACQTTKAIR